MDVLKSKALPESSRVFISDSDMIALDARRNVPEGYRPAVVKDIAFRYKHDEEFRKELSNGWIWVAERGLEGADHHRIHNDGSLTKVSAQVYLDLPYPERAVLRPGDGFVAIRCDAGTEDGRLIIDAQNVVVRANTAYLEDDSLKGAPKIALHSKSFKESFRRSWELRGSSDI
jgi:hypothetical protein